MWLVGQPVVSSVFWWTLSAWWSLRIHWDDTQPCYTCTASCRTSSWRIAGHPRLQSFLPCRAAHHCQIIGPAVFHQFGISRLAFVTLRCILLVVKVLLCGISKILSTLRKTWEIIVSWWVLPLMILKVEESGHIALEAFQSSLVVFGLGGVDEFVSFISWDHERDSIS